MTAPCPPSFSGTSHAADTTAAAITVSVVSHGHGSMVKHLLARLLSFPEVAGIVLTLNIPEKIDIEENTRLSIVRNTRPKGFGENHNAAFAQSRTAFFCVLNPDIELPQNPFPALMQCLSAHPRAVAAPRIIDPQGKPEDSARRFPTPGSILRKILFADPGLSHVKANGGPQESDWLAGMFLLFPGEVFTALDGFDESYFLYYEDVDLCARAWFAGYPALWVPAACAVHEARRASRRKLRHFLWHAASMLRYFARWYLNGRLQRLQALRDDPKRDGNR